jgi:peptide methionine sulfoxide reductase MsrA
MVWFDPKKTSYEALLKTFWEGHDPTQGMRQGNDVGTQYRSGVYTFSPEQKQKAEASKATFQKELAKNGMAAITTEIVDAPTFYLCRGLPSAVSRQEPERLLRPRRHRRELPDRSRRRGGVTRRARHPEHLRGIFVQTLRSANS